MATDDGDLQTRVKHLEEEVRALNALADSLADVIEEMGLASHGQLVEKFQANLNRELRHRY